jgi:hypothetical protein
VTNSVHASAVHLPVVPSARPYSYSRLRRFAQCPLSYKLHYVDRLPAASSDESDLGRVLHRTLEDLVRDHVRTGLEGPLDIAIASATYQRVWSESPLSDPAVFGEGLALVKRWVAREGIVDPQAVLGIEASKSPKRVADGKAGVARGRRSQVGWYAEDVTLYAISNLLQRQEGYRWAVGKHDKLLPGWEADWVVIGDVMGGDPIIAAPKERGTPIYWAMHGAGKWKPVRAAASLAQGAEALAEWLDVFRGEFGGNISDADFVPRPDAIKAIKSRVAKVVGAGAVSPWLPS